MDLSLFERAQIAIARRAVRAPDAWVKLLTQRPRQLGGYSLDQRSQYMFQLDKFSGRPLSDMPAPDARRQFKALTVVLDDPPPDIERVQELSVPTRAVARLGRAYYPTGAASTSPLPALVYFHGGGFTFGDLDTHDVFCRRLCAGSGCVVVSIDYRLGPESPFPAAVEDGVDAFRWVLANAETLRVAKSAIGVGGDSAGGNLAAVVSMVARDEGDPSPKAQLLIYPAVGTTRHEGRQEPELQEGYGLDRALTRWFADNYLPDGHTEQPYAAPLHAESHGGLAPAIVVTAQFDLLCKEGLAYVEALRSANVPVQALHYNDLAHGFVTMSVLPRAREAIADICGATRKALEA